MNLPDCFHISKFYCFVYWLFYKFYLKLTATLLLNLCCWVISPLWGINTYIPKVRNHCSFQHCVYKKSNGYFQLLLKLYVVTSGYFTNYCTIITLAEKYKHYTKGLCKWYAYFTFVSVKQWVLIRNFGVTLCLITYVGKNS